MAEDSLPGSKSNVEVPNDEFSESRSSTQVLLVKHRHTWTIEYNTILLFQKGEKLVSPTFSTGINNNKSEWRLILYPNNGATNSTEIKNLCWLELIACNMNELQAEYKIHILNNMGIEKQTQNSHLFEKGHRYPVLTGKRLLLFTDQLSVVCEISYKVSSEKNKLERLQILPSTSAMDFTFLLESKQLSDVTLCVSGKEFPAHKVILSARSPVFRAMFQNDMEESRNNRVEITDMDEEGLSEMLRYMYTGEIKALEKMAPHLLGIAEKYDLEDLKIRCEEALLKSLSLENVVEFFILGDTFRATNLSNQVKKFIKAHVSVIVIRPEFQTMVRTHPHLGIEAFCLVGCSEPSS